MGDGPALGRRAAGRMLAVLGTGASFVPTAFAVDPPASVQAPASAEQWGIFEIVLKGPSDGNPFVDVQLSARFSDGARSIEVDGFYDGDGTYRLRFMPPRTGRWQWTTQSNRWPLTNRQGSFVATLPRAGNHGPVGVRHGYHFAYADGTPFKPIGTTSYSWAHRGDALEEKTLAALAAAPFNKLRMLVYPQSAGIERHPPVHFPFAGSPPRQWDLSRFNPAFWRHLEQRVGQLRDLGIEADLIVHHPYDDAHAWGFDELPREVDDRYASYLVARLAAYRNVWWAMANEFDFVRTRTDGDWDHLFQLIRRKDPYQHLRSIHNGKRLYDHANPWVTHVSLQNGMAAAEASRAVQFRDVWRKPVIFDEVKYEGRHDRRWAQLSGPEMVQRFWAVTIAGSYASHGEFVPGADGTFWLAHGVQLRGESPSRLAFLRHVLAEAPAEGIDPIDTFEELKIAGQPGRYYLVYFGAETPTQWLPRLPVAGMADGLAFEVDRIDTWNMTIERLPQPLVFGPHDRYTYAARVDRPVALPGRPWMALRLRVVEAAATGAAAVDD